ncbi:MAG: hypothetical protein AAF321_08900, partial [Pseudomonadota bacterium]
MNGYARQAPLWAPDYEAARSERPQAPPRGSLASDDPRTATLEKLARLRDTLSGLQQPKRRPAPKSAPNPNANLEGAVERILRRREEAVGIASSNTDLPNEMNEVRRQLADLSTAIAQRPIAPQKPDTADLEGLREDINGRLDSYLHAIDQKVDRGLRQRGTEDVAVALRDLSRRFDEETAQNAERQSVEAGRLAQHVDRKVDVLAEAMGGRVDDAVRRAQSYLIEHGAEMTRENRVVYEQILTGIGDLTDAFTMRLESAVDEKALSEIEGRLTDLTDMMATIERNVNDAPVLRRVERELKTLMDPSLGLEARLNARFDTIDTRLAAKPDDRSLIEINEKIDHLAGTLSASHSALDPQSAARIEAEIQALQDRVIRSAEQNEALLREMSGRIAAQPADFGPVLQQIEERLTALQSRPAPTAPVVGNAYAEEQIDTLVTRIEALVAGGGDGHSSAQLEQQLAILSERIDHYAASAQQGGVSREEILETVQRAAEQTLQHALANAPSGDGGAAAAAAVREGLAELRSTQEMGDRRTKDALETVRDTVERVFHRLEALEKARPAQRQQQPAEAPAPAPNPAEAMPAAPIDTDSSFAVDDRLRAAQEQSHDMPEDWAPIAPGGTELPRRNKAPRIDGSEATPNSRASFIAAARLAA